MRRMASGVVLAGLLLLAACRGEGQPGSASASGPVPAPTAAQPAAVQPAGPALPAVTPARIDAFLAYQRQRLALDAALWKELGARGLRGADAGAGDAQGALELLEQRALEEARVQAAQGLSREELLALGTLVREVLEPRQLARELGLAETVALLEEQGARLSGGPREELEEQLAPLRARLAELESLAGPRARHGDAAVEAVLARETELLAWEAERLLSLTGP